MCGIFGGINAGFSAQTLERLEHRGPDQSSYGVESTEQGAELSFGQTRLNVVCRDDVELPVRMNDTTIVYNGEIYNHPELRSELEALGHTFRTRTDTEVALAAYLQWGPGCLERFNGNPRR